MGLLGPGSTHTLGRGQRQAVHGKGSGRSSAGHRDRPYRSSPCPSKEASKQQARQAGLIAHQPSLCWGFHRDGEVYILVWPAQPQCE